MHNVKPGTYTYSMRRTTTTGIPIECKGCRMNKQVWPFNKLNTLLLGKGLLLCLMLFVSILVYAENNDEIGVPVFPKVDKDLLVDGAFMAPDGEHFYTLREGLLTKFTINPFKKVSSNLIDFKEALFRNNIFKVFITQDEKRLIISNNKKAQITLVDIATGQVFKVVKIDNSPSMMIDALLNGNEFLVFKDDEILVFDANSLNKIKEFPFEWRAFRRFSNVKKIFNKIIYRDERTIGLLYGKKFWKKELFTHLNLPKSNKCRGNAFSDGYITFDFSTFDNGMIKDFNICGFPVANDESFVDKRTIEFNFGPVSTAGHYVVSGYIYKLENLKNGKKYRIDQYQDGEVILFELASNEFLTLSSKAQKHLKMKDSRGEIVPMNDATFEKFKLPSP